MTARQKLDSISCGQFASKRGPERQEAQVAETGADLGFCAWMDGASRKGVSALKRQDL